MEALEQLLVCLNIVSETEMDRVNISRIFLREIAIPLVLEAIRETLN